MVKDSSVPSLMNNITETNHESSVNNLIINSTVASEDINTLKKLSSNNVKDFKDVKSSLM